MTKFLFLLAILAAGTAQAQNYLCSDGTRITRNSQARVIHVSIDGAQLTCTLTASAPGPGTCSVSSKDKCAGQQVSTGDCGTQFGAYGKCMSDSTTLGTDGNPVCGCGVGE